MKKAKNIAKYVIVIVLVLMMAMSVILPILSTL